MKKYSIFLLLLLSINVFAKGYWVVEAKCAVFLPPKNGREDAMYVWGKGRDPDYDKACALAKKDVDINKPSGSGQKKHCECSTKAQSVYERRSIVDICRY